MNNKICLSCGARDCIRKGVQSGHQRWQCRRCRTKFQANGKAPPDPEELFCLYTFNKQTLVELAQAYHIETKRVQRMIDEVALPAKQHRPREISLVVDTTFIGDIGVMVFRDAREKENLWWMFVEREYAWDYAYGRQALEDLGYTITSVTADGLPGLPAVFSDILFQFCHFHAKKSVTRYLTRKPNTEAGGELRRLMNRIRYYQYQSFYAAMRAWAEKHRSFLAEKTYHPSGRWSYTHKRLRSALNSMMRMAPYLFTYQRTELFIPTTTNTLEGHFRHLRVRVNAHSGLSDQRKRKLIHAILLNSTTKYTKNMHKRLFRS